MFPPAAFEENGWNGVNRLKGTWRCDAFRLVASMAFYGIYVNGKLVNHELGELLPELVIGDFMREI